ncbi:hypothetical protein T03_4470 [Trichinella britovi]|uniref:C2H2-type domain-containing protein n=2 Tax=Trichinella TaxID=6333 RepID=A0A0V1C990_TRIBR|nr:hypothetical protein T05_16256 [Trichinella murrelli]KRY45881.1 hypothetical protein T03_4470 [Trichinella britovi]
MTDTNVPSRFTKRVKVAVFLVLKRTFCNQLLDESLKRNDMQECDYICAPPLMATNKLTDHEKIGSHSGRWKRISDGRRPDVLKYEELQV